MNLRIKMNKLEKILIESKGKQQVTQCCACKKIKTYHGYREVPEPVLKEIYNNHPISHGYCPPCLEEQYTEILIMERIYAKNLMKY